MLKTSFVVALLEWDATREILKVDSLVRLFELDVAMEILKMESLVGGLLESRKVPARYLDVPLGPVELMIAVDD